MAQTKRRPAAKTAKKPTAKTKASPAKKTSAGKKTPQTANYKAKYEKRRQSRRQMSAVLLFTVGVLIAAVALIPGTNFWRWCHDFLLGLCGLTIIAVPVSLIYIAVMATLDKSSGEIHNKVWQSAVLVMLICALVEVCQPVPFSGNDFFPVLIRLYDNGVALSGGGLLSALIGWPLYVGCGRVGTIIILVLVLFTFIMLLTGSTLIGLFRGIVKPVKKIEESYAAKREELERAAEAKFDIDVDLGPAPEQAPESSADVPKPAIQELLEAEKARAEQEIREVKAARKQRSKKMQGESETTVETDAAQILPEPSIDISLHKADSPQRREAEALVEQALSGKKPDEPDSSEEGQTRLYPEENTGDTYIKPPIGLLRAPRASANMDVSAEQNRNAQLLVETLKSFGVQVHILNISRGPSVTRYELQPSAGVKISRITGLADDLALNLAASGVRIEAPIPGKPAVGIEVPNQQTDVVTMREIIDSVEFDRAKSKLSVALGRDIAGNCVIADIAKMPHMLIAGATGSGKSVCINSIIISLLYKASPSEVRFLMVDPKVVELGIYNGIPHLLVPVVTDPRKAAGALGWAVTEMLKRYNAFAENNVRDLEGYNALAREKEDLVPMPQIVIIIDELSDLMMAAPNEVEDAICRLAQMARAAGMHLIIATQRPSVDVVTGLIKANVPSRIAFAVSSQVDSRTILDSGGAEKLLGRGDMLFAPVGMPKPVRVQGCYVSDKEVEQVVAFVKNKETVEYDDQIIEEIEKQAVAEKKQGSSDNGGGFDDSDTLLSDAIQCVVEAGQASTSFIQRKLRVGYARAARLVDEMEEKGIVGPADGSKPRQVLITRQQWIEMRMNEDGGEVFHE